MLRRLGRPRLSSVRAPQLPAGPWVPDRAAAASPSASAPGRTSVTPLPLSYMVFDGPAPQPPLVFLHGLLGSKGNFRAIARALVQRSGRKVLTVDARNHGESPHSPTMSYEAMSLDVQRLLCQLRLPKCILVGHSMGGKTAMTLALQQVSAVRQFLLTNLVEAEGRYVWRVNLEAISHHMANIMGFPVFHAPYPGPTLFLAGSDSPYVSSEDYPEIERLFPEAEIQYIPGAGHWVHADKSQEFVTAICNFLLLP
ncbi:sn-1-specific diacylglycerol lipase ABHD11 isoform X2 [Caretta caretta]|uniref:sn-1-specific diacylglycerol lipase ABHD11 isoform X2 n=1 Tax=Caretta caretta TaxID=8467 RepID=UPI003F4BA5BF